MSFCERSTRFRCTHATALLSSNGEDWSNRELIERSSAVKVPTVASQLQRQKVQEALSNRDLDSIPEIVET